MKRRTRIIYTAQQRALMWERSTIEITGNGPGYNFLINVVYNINSLISEPLLWLSN